MELIDRFPTARADQLRLVLQEKYAWLLQEKKGFLRYRTPYQQVCHLRASTCNFAERSVHIGTAGDLNPEQQQDVKEVLRTFMPWRKGPFSVFGIDIDAEWQSFRKWERLSPYLPDLSGKVIADIGCNNGYYMFRLLAHKPKFVLGFEPYVQHYYTFKTLNAFAAQPQLQLEPLGIEHLPLFPESFDIILCLGILYHRPSPLDALRDLHQALKPGGILFLESQAIPGEEPLALFPEKTYAKVPGTWFVPTASCLKNWITRAGFSTPQLICDHAMSTEEQRRTDWMTFESYEDFIDKENPRLTIEGYPAPRRVFFRVEK